MVPHTTILEQQMNSLLLQTLAPSTTRQYSNACKSYQSFCSQYNLLSFPLIEHTLMLYTTHLSNRSSYKNIKLHLAAVKHFTILLSYQTIIPPMPRLYLLVRAIKRKQGNKYSKQKRLPITTSLMQKIHHYIQVSSLSSHDKHMLWAAATTAFFGFLRASEFVASTTKKYDPNTTLQATDITITPTQAIIHLKSSKTDPFRQGCDIRLNRTNTPDLCPVHSLSYFITKFSSKQGPIFTYQDGTYLTRRRLNKFLKAAIPTTTSPISSHSFRIGAATTAAAAGLPRWLIQKLGRWSSDCYRTYIELPNNMLTHAQRLMSVTLNVGATWDPDHLAIQ